MTTTELSILKDLNALLPVIGLFVLIVIVMAIDLIFPKRNSLLRHTLIFGTLMLGYGISKFAISTDFIYTKFVSLDGFSIFFHILFTGILFFTFLQSGLYFERTKIKYPETSLLLMLSSVGAMLMIAANDLMLLFLGLELMSICLYVLAGMLRKRVRSNEGALKYFLLGAFSTGFFLYGIVLLFGITGSTNYQDISYWISNSSNQLSLSFWLGIGLFLIGFFFKMAIVPFHFWSPDAYEGAPTPVTAFFSATPKAAAFGSLTKILIVAIPLLGMDLQVIFMVLSIATMLIGNVVALQQKSIKRMLAYSSISHAGYLLVAFVSRNDVGYSSILLYFIVYSITNLGAFTIAYLVNRKNEGSYSYDDYNGLASKHPALSLFMAIFMISLAGIPPTGGFFAKYYIFYSAIQSNHVTLAVTMALLSAVSVYYYLKVIVHMYFHPASDNFIAVESNPHIGLGLTFSTILIFGIGIFPSFWLSLVSKSISSLLYFPSIP